VSAGRRSSAARYPVTKKRLARNIPRPVRDAEEVSSTPRKLTGWPFGAEGGVPRWRGRCVGGVGRRIQGDRGIECTYLVLSRASIVEERVEGARGERAERSLRGEDRVGETW